MTVKLITSPKNDASQIVRLHGIFRDGIGMPAHFPWRQQPQPLPVVAPGLAQLSAWLLQAGQEASVYAVQKYRV